MKSFIMDNGNEIEVEEEIRFTDLWQDETGDLDELLESGSVCIGCTEDDLPVIAGFEIVEYDVEEPVKTLVKITEFY